MVNNVVLVGRLTANPEMRYTPNGTAVTTFRLAVSRPPRRNSQEERADFIDIVTWRQTAEFCGNYLDKGALVAVEGRLQTRSWETQDGQRRQA
ncbi:MAG: single-stranded DNA-binding protein, partial [Armatimonadota bacterium]